MMRSLTRGASMVLFVALCVSSVVASASGVADLKEARAAGQRGEYESAIRLSTLAIESGKLSLEYRAIAFSIRGKARLEEKKYGRAIADFTEALRLKPQYGYALYNRAIAWQYKGDPDQAIADYTDAIRLKPEAARLFFDRGTAWYQKKDYHRAIADYTEAIRLAPKHAVFFYNRGNAWYHQQHYRRAIADFTEALLLNPNFPDALTNRGFAQFYLARFKRAATDFAQWRKLKPHNAYAAIWLYLARARAGVRNAASVLSEGARQFKAHRWPAPIVALYTGRIDAKAALDQAAEAAPKTKKRQICEADFYVGQWYLLKHQGGHAHTLFDGAKSECPKAFVEYSGAVAELKRR